mgnify:CR=1 FL=1
MSNVNDFMIKKFNTDIGQKATVERHETASELATRANRTLRHLGETLNPIGEHLKYMGSASIHVYQSEMLGQLFFLSQTDTMQDCPEPLASRAFDSLRSDLMAFYGRNRQTKRSGF